MTQIIVTFPLMMAVLVAVLLQFLVGYNTAVMNAPAAVVFPEHSSSVWAVAVAAFAIGGPFGAIFGGYSANRLGRRWVYLEACTSAACTGLMLAPYLSCSRA